MALRTFIQSLGARHFLDFDPVTGTDLTTEGTQMSNIEKAVSLLIDRKFQNLRAELSAEIISARQANGERTGAIEDRLASLRASTDIKFTEMKAELKEEIKDLFHEMDKADTEFRQSFQTIKAWVQYFILPVAVALVVGGVGWVFKILLTTVGK